jgi:CTP synthase (UTP-ammonia lyase)
VAHPTIALLGDFCADVVAHRAIPLALERAVGETRCDVNWRWIPTTDIRHPATDLADISALWVVPASPYANTTGVLDAIRFARETGRPFLGTCGGFQHALIEFARNVAGLADADHAETNPAAELPLISLLSCSLVEKTGVVRFNPASRLREIYGADTTHEGYHCRFGLNPDYTSALESSGLRFSAFDASGDIRAFELPVHPFFIGTLFQPERAALRNEPAPLINAFVRAAAT